MEQINSKEQIVKKLEDFKKVTSDFFAGNLNISTIEYMEAKSRMVSECKDLM